MKKFLILLVSLCFGGFASAQLSPSSQISLLTCAPGEAVYAKFGHSAIRIYDPEMHIDVVFHYGIFDYNTEWFIPKFVKGETDYEVGVIPTNYFLAEYKQRGSSVYEQVLALNEAQRNQLYTDLWINYEPQNRKYRYNFVFDNCATRPYHMILNTLDAPVLCSYSTDVTYRDIIGQYIGYHNWTRFGIDLVIGAEADRKTGNEGAISFPLYLKDELAASWIQVATDTIVPLVAQTNTLVNAAPKAVENTPFLLSPLVILSLLLCLGGFLTYYDWRRKRYSAWFDVLLFGSVGLLGIIVFYLMCFSLHPLVHANWNLLWVNPFLVIFAIFAPMKWCAKATKHMAYYVLILLLASLATTAFAPQLFHVANLPIILLLILRTIFYIRKPIITHG